jgi:ParB/RepB/Spo0J family partition protein
MTSKFNPALLASIAAGASLGTNTPDVNDIGVADIPIALIDPNPYQPRLDYDPVEVRALADSIKEYSLLQSIVVRRDGDRYTLIAGQTRLEAHKLLGREMIKSNIIDASDEDIASLALIENVQRSDLHPIEIQIALSREPFASMNDEEIRGITGYSLTKIRNIRSISRLSEEVREHMSANRPKIGVELLVELQKFPESSQITYYNLILSGNANRNYLRNKLAIRELHEKQKNIKSSSIVREGSGYRLCLGYGYRPDIREQFEVELNALVEKYNKIKG